MLIQKCEQARSIEPLNILYYWALKMVSWCKCWKQRSYEKYVWILYSVKSGAFKSSLLHHPYPKKAVKNKLNTTVPPVAHLSQPHEFTKVSTAIAIYLTENFEGCKKSLMSWKKVSFVINWNLIMLVTRVHVCLRALIIAAQLGYMLVT